MKVIDKLHSIAGEDYGLLGQCAPDTLRSFTVVAILMPIIAAMCMLSNLITFYKVFSNFIPALLLALLFSYLLMNIYRLLLYKATPDPLPQISSKSGIIVSKLVRWFFLGVIVLIVAKPLETVVYGNALALDIQEYKVLLKNQNHERIMFYYGKQIKDIQRISNDEMYSNMLCHEKEAEAALVVNSAYRLIDQSCFYLQQIRLLFSKYPGSWLFTSVVTLILFFPLYLKHSLRRSDYYMLIKKINRRKVELNYYAFCKKLESLFEKKYAQKIKVTTQYEDPPYNTLKIVDKRSFVKQEELISELYHV